MLLDTTVLQSVGFSLHIPPTTADGLLEGPTADTDEKGGCPMSDSLVLSFRAEVRDFLRSSERLIAATVTSNYTPMTQDEREIVEYYLAEVGKMLAPLGQQK